MAVKSLHQFFYYHNKYLNSMNCREISMGPFICTIQCRRFSILCKNWHIILTSSSGQRSMSPESCILKFCGILACKITCMLIVSNMQPHEHHFPITAIYKMSPSPPAFPRLLAMVIVKIYIVGWFCGLILWWSWPLPSGAHGGLVTRPFENS
jgi:hypothetical protein